MWTKTFYVVCKPTTFTICLCVSLANWLTSFAMGVCKKHVFKNPWESDQLCVYAMFNEALHVSTEQKFGGFFKLIQPRRHVPLADSAGEHVEVCIKAYHTLQDLLSTHIRFQAYRRPHRAMSCCVEIQKPKPLCWCRGVLTAGDWAAAPPFVYCECMSATPEHS